MAAVQRCWAIRMPMAWSMMLLETMASASCVWGWA